MNLKKATRRGHHTLNELNITPLLDLVFVLLVIFIITTPQLVNNLEMILPSPQPPPPPPLNAPKPKVHQIAVDAKGQVFLNEEPLALGVFQEKLQQIKAVDPELRVVVHGADEVDYQHIVNVLDILQQLDISKVGLATAAAGN